jgi:hypothetical protein
MPLVGRLRATGRAAFKFEPSGLRTMLAATVPLFSGQAAGHVAIGLMVGLGGLYVSIADKEGARWPTLLVATFAVATTGFIATLAGGVTWAAVTVMFGAAFIAGMLGAFGHVAFNIGFAAAIACAVITGMPNNSHVAVERMVEFAAGGLWCTLLTLLLWRYNYRSGATTARRAPDTAAPRDSSARIAAEALRRIRENLTFRSVDFQHAWRLGIVSALAVALYRHFHLEHGYWLTLTTLVIVKPVYTDTRQRALERVGGSFAGGLIGVLLAALIHNVLVLDLLLALTCLLAYSHLPYSYTWFAAFLTPFVVLMINIAAPGNWQIALVRVFNTFLGGAIALIVAALLRPRDTPPLEAPEGAAP